ncbi:hypothetical protein LMG33818_002636 [Halomonadaceae bacterium LMG 33818]|uniref:helix-turn-helix domain-containing protein n=1 Tax=Cernens ardua TaxID=3402176 RepID=UPI003EDC0CF2
MNTPIETQILNDQAGNPLYVLMPYDEYIGMLNKEEKTIPQEVMELEVLNDITPIAAWRKYLKLTQKEVAERLGMSQANFSAIEKTDNPRNETLKKVAKALGIDPGQLVY